MRECADVSAFTPTRSVSVTMKTDSIFVPVLESWTEGRTITGVVHFQWPKTQSMPPECAKLQELHMADKIGDGDLPNVGRARSRVNRFATSIDIDMGVWRAEAGVEVLRV
jgi:hypothetical protein